MPDDLTPNKLTPWAEVPNPHCTPEPTQFAKNPTDAQASLEPLWTKTIERDAGLGIFLQVPQGTTTLETPDIKV